MLDGFLLKGTPINYQNEDWVIGDVLFVPGNPELFVQLKKNGSNMNVRLKEISSIVTTEPKLVDIYEYDFV
jgi:hypothetical protein